ncbi:hypothetical protein EP7_003439 [Isosphaeraceae bacterium EP7]
MNPTDAASPSEPSPTYTSPRGRLAAGPSMTPVMGLALLAALVAGLLAWLVGETPFGTVRPSRVWINTLGNLNLSTTHDTELKALTASSARVYGAFGLLLGLTLGLAGALARGGIRSGLKPALIGAILGAIAGGALPFLAVPLHDSLRTSIPDETLASIMMHGLIWGTIGAAVSVALGLGAEGGSRRRVVACIAGGVIGALVGTAVYEVVGAMAFPLDETGEAISKSSASRLLARLIVGLSIALGASTAFSESRRRNEDPVAPTPEV